MSIRFILGRAGSGKTFTCLQAIAEASKTEPLGAPLILLVPEQASLEMEKELAVMCGGGTFRAQVLSFRRLAYRLLQASGSQLPVMTELGRQLLLRRLLQDETSSLSAFARAARQPHFCQQLAVQLREFKHYQITTDNLAALAQSVDCPTALRGKLADLAAIYTAYHAATAGSYTDSEDTLTQLAAAIAAGGLPQQTKVWVDGFAGFTPQEFSVLGALMGAVSHLEIALCLDPHTKKQPQEEDLFHPTQDTYWRLRRLSGETAVKVLPPLELPQANQTTRFSAAAPLAHLEANFAVFPLIPYQQQTSCLQLVTTAGPRAEVEAAARDIVQRVREEGWRYRDIGIILRNFSTYHDLVAAIFLDFDIPYYVDERRSAAHHPLVEFLRSAVDTVSSNFSCQPIMQLLKTDLFPLRRQDVDQLENYVLAHGIYGSRWLTDKPWNYHHQLTLAEERAEQTTSEDTSKLVDDTRRQFIKIFGPFAQAVGGGEKQVVAVYCQALWKLLEQVEAAQTLQNWAETASADGQLSQALEHRQVWQGVVELLEQLVGILGNQQLTPPEFAQVLGTGLENLKLGLVPAMTDRVVIGNVERSRQPRLLAAYVLGLSEGDFPARLQEEGLFADEEREALGDNGLELAVTRRQRLFHEQYLSYIALTRSSDYLWVSCPLADDEGKAKRPSALFNHLREFFPVNEVQFYGNTPDPQEDYQAVTKPHRIAAALLQQAGTALRGGAISPFWAAVYNEALAHAPTSTKLQQLWPALNYQNHIPSLQPATVRALFGTKLHSSVSRLEQFAQCPFAHFARYGLRLKERADFSLEAPDMGMFFHAALRIFVTQLLEEKLAWSALTIEEAVVRINEIVDDLVPQLHREILLSSARLRFLAARLKETLAQAITALTIHAQQSVFQPVAVELPFGGGELPAWQLQYGQQEIMLHGQIDRLDVAEANGQVYYRVIDYKSTPTSLKLSELWYGLSLQLLTYLAVVNENKANFSQLAGKGVGALYFGIYRPFTRVANPGAAAEEAVPKLDGLILADQQVFKLMGGEKLVHAALKKDGNFTKVSRVAEETQLQQLLQYVCEQIGESAVRILQGEVTIKPFKKPDGRKACTYCPFMPLCCFDVTVEGNQYRLISPLAAEEVLQAVAAKQEGASQDE
ncbi:MAG TPA: helicase-exonuclease AddAB subunit AddB [Oscillospiraceae bacterium]|nr:helicase-exonuclease AddAB subunit AddB [Oscillospiraceae bacterium]